MARVFVDPVEIRISTERALKETFEWSLGRFWSLDYLEYFLGTNLYILQLCCVFLLGALMLFNTRLMLFLNVEIHSYERSFAIVTKSASHAVLLLGIFFLK